MSCRRKFTLPLFVLLFCFPLTSPVYAEEEALRLFLAGSTLSAGAQEELADRFPASPGFMLIERPEGIYALAAEPFSVRDNSEDPEIGAIYEQSVLQRLSMRATRAIVLRLLNDRLDRKTFKDEDALGGALVRFYGNERIVGIQSRSGVAEDTAFSLVWLLRRDAPSMLENAPRKNEDLQEDYCEVLYERARGYMHSGIYTEALAVFKHIHDFQFANVGAYLDASECFLRTGGAEDAGRLLSELLNTLGEQMTSDELARSGRLFREAGRREEARKSFVKARERFREGR